MDGLLRLCDNKRALPVQFFPRECLFYLFNSTNNWQVYNGKIEGRVTWPTINNAETKFRGTLVGANIEFEEYEVNLFIFVISNVSDYQGRRRCGRFSVFFRFAFTQFQFRNRTRAKLLALLL